MTDTMRAYVITTPGGPDRLELRVVPRPLLREGWVLIRVRAFGLNRSEWFTRRGVSPSPGHRTALSARQEGSPH